MRVRQSWYQCVQVQAMIGARKAMAFDLTAACSGFVVALITAAQFIRTGHYRNIVIIGADALSRYVDWRDRGEIVSRSLFHLVSFDNLNVYRSDMYNEVIIMRSLQRI